MTLSKKQIESLIQSVLNTRNDEIGCDECMTDLAEFAERSLAGKSVREGQQAVKHHLEICGECRDEYEALLRSLRE